MVFDGLGDVGGDAGGGGDLFEGGGAEAVEGVEAVEEAFAAAGADAGDAIEDGGGAGFSAALAVAGIGEAVGFIAGALDEEEAFGTGGEEDRSGLAGDKNFFFSFGEAGDGDLGVEAEFLEDVEGDAELAFAAIDEEEVGEDGPSGFFLFLADLLEVVEFAILVVEVAAEAAGEGFAHGAVIVIGDGLDIEAAVIFFVGGALEEDDHRGDGMGALGVADIVAFDAGGGRGEAEGFLEFGHGGDMFRAVGGPLLAEGAEGVMSVGDGHVDEIFLFATARDLDRDFGASFLT